MHVCNQSLTDQHICCCVSLDQFRKWTAVHRRRFKHITRPSVHKTVAEILNVRTDGNKRKTAAGHKVARGRKSTSYKTAPSAKRGEAAHTVTLQLYTTEVSLFVSNKLAIRRICAVQTGLEANANTALIRSCSIYEAGREGERVFLLGCPLLSTNLILFELLRKLLPFL